MKPAADGSHTDFGRLDTIDRLALLGRLLSSAIHDTRNALQVIGGNTELLQSLPADAERVLARAAAIRVQTERAAALLNDLHDLAAERAGETVERVDLRTVVERVVKLRQTSFGRARIAIDVSLDSGPFHVQADRRVLTRLIANLVLNAEAFVKGRPNARVGVSLCSEAGRITLRVHDNRPSPDPVDLALLFEPLTRGGPGEGLSVSRWHAERFGGTLIAVTPPDGGVVCELRLPADAGS